MLQNIPPQTTETLEKGKQSRQKTSDQNIAKCKNLNQNIKSVLFLTTHWDGNV